LLPVRILAVSGSLQAKSGNLALLRTAVASAPEGVEVMIFDGVRDLPLFDPDLEARGAPPAVGTWRRALAESDALLIATPEYGYSLPGALKSAIDWVIGSGELYHKVVAITAAVPGPERGRGGLGALRQALQAVDATVLHGEPVAWGPTFEAAVAALVRSIVEAPVRVPSDG